MINNRDNNGRIKSKYKDEDFIPLCKEYEVNKNAKEIATREGIPLQTMYYYIRKLGYKQSKRLHDLNEDYFKIINTQNKAYILGFLMADGCVCKSEPSKSSPDRLIINISIKDKNILEFIKKELECSYQIREYTPAESTYSNNMMCSLTINSMKLCSDLIKHGVIPNKTGKETFPKLPKKLKRHFIRGFLDGDGWITTANKNTTTSIGFISNYEMLLSLKNEIANEVYIYGSSPIKEDYRENKKNKNIYTLQYSHKDDVRQLKQFLYKNANFYLERKYSKLT